MNKVKYVRNQIASAVSQIRYSYKNYQKIAYNNPEIFSLPSGRISERKLTIDEIYTHFDFIRGIIYGFYVGDLLTTEEYDILWKYVDRVVNTMLNIYVYNC